LYTRVFVDPVRSSSARAQASRRSSFAPLFSGATTTTSSATCGDSSSWSHALCNPSSRHRWTRPGILFTASTSAAPFVSTTIDFSRLPDGPITAKVQLVGWASSPT
jgi:hypothetical protein